jgi:hypothetical protein
MAPFEGVACLAMIKLVQIHVPPNRHKHLSVVFRVAFHATTLVADLFHQGRVIAAPLSQPGPDLRVTAQAIELCLSRPDYVAGRAMSWTIQGMVCL